MTNCYENVLNDWYETSTIIIYETTDQESVIEISKFKMADPKQQSANAIYATLIMKRIDFWGYLTFVKKWKCFIWFL